MVKCIGGYARIIATVKRLKEEKADLNPIYLNAGDNFQGTLWYTLLRWNVTKYMLNLVPADAMVRNHLNFVLSDTIFFFKLDNWKP
jgi:5'-nucleotidase